MSKNLFARKIPESGKGLLIAFMGQDGAGKSTVTDDILKWLQFKIEAQKYYLGSGDHYHSWQKLLRMKIPSSNLFTKSIGGFLAVSDAKNLARRTKKCLIKAKRYRDNGGIAIFDRFPQMQYPGINDGPKIRKNLLPKVSSNFLKIIIGWYADIEEKYISKAVCINPDVVFKLILPPEVSIQRKPEENLENVTIKHNIIKSLEFPESKVYVLDATQPYDEELKEIKKIIWSTIVRNEQ